MKLTDKQLDKLIEIVKKSLKKRLGREPNEKEVVDKLPIFLCKSIKE